MKVLVCGGRSFSSYTTVERYLDMLNALNGFTLVIHGAAIGADTLAGEWAHHRYIDVKKFPADWKTHRKSAGPIRNRQMLDEGEPDLVVVFPGGKGTGNMKMQALGAGVRVIDLAEEAVRRRIEADYQALHGLNGAARF